LHLCRRYCRFYQGRRSADDARQIGRWAGVTGAKGRWKRALLNKIVAANARWDDASISPVIRQTLLHWCDCAAMQDASMRLRSQVTDAARQGVRGDGGGRGGARGGVRRGRNGGRADATDRRVKKKVL
jgi:hypothetical protein